MKHLLKVTGRKIEETFVNIYTNKEEIFYYPKKKRTIYTYPQSVILQYGTSSYQSIILNKELFTLINNQ